jgi:hypothetical protein
MPTATPCLILEKTRFYQEMFTVDVDDRGHMDVSVDVPLIKLEFNEPSTPAEVRERLWPYNGQPVNIDYSGDFPRLVTGVLCVEPDGGIGIIRNLHGSEPERRKQEFGIAALKEANADGSINECFSYESIVVKFRQPRDTYSASGQPHP